MHITPLIIALFFLVGYLMKMLISRIYKVGLQMLLEEKGEKP
jgi:hypothetical protein